MFGLDKISWTQFSLFLMYTVIAWYAGLFVLAWIKGQTASSKTLFEYDELEAGPKEILLPVTVSSSDFPREMISFAKQEDEELITDLYEDNGIDDGYPLDQFSERNLSGSPELLKSLRIRH